MQKSLPSFSNRQQFLFLEESNINFKLSIDIWKMNFPEENFPSLLNLKYNVSLITHLEMKETKLILLGADKREKKKKVLPAWSPSPSNPRNSIVYKEGK